MPVYPTPLPASELMTTDGVWLSRKGRSWPMLVCSICFFVISVLVKGALSPARRARISTGCMNRVSFSFEAVEAGWAGGVAGAVWALAIRADPSRQHTKNDLVNR